MEEHKLTKKEKENQGNGHKLKILGNLTNDLSEIASAFNTYFTASVQNLSHTCGARIKNIAAPNFKPIFKTTEVLENKVCTILSTLKSSKANDIFKWDSTFLKTNIHSLSTPITHVVNLSIKHFFQLVAVVVPIFRAGEPTDVAN